MRLFVLVLTSLFLFTGCVTHGGGGGKQCKNGKPCGNSCISRSYTCHKGGLEIVEPNRSEALGEIP